MCHGHHLFSSSLTLRDQDIYRHSKNLQKHPNYSVMSHKIPSTLSLHEEPMHAHKKRLIGKTLAPSSIQHFESVILEQVHKFCSCLSLAGRDNLPAGKREEPTSQWTIPRNMAQWCKHHVVQCLLPRLTRTGDYLFFDITGKVLFNAVFDTLDKAENRLIIDAIEITKLRHTVLSYFPGLMTWNLDRLLFAREVFHGLKFIQFVSKMVREKVADVENADAKDALSKCRISVDPVTNEKMTRGSLTAESAMLIIAGADTGSTTMAALFFYLSRNQTAYDKLCQEIRSHFPTPEFVHLGPTLSSCHYLRACIDETLRMSPSIGSAPARLVLRGGTTIAGEDIPAGTAVGTGIYSVQHADELGDPFVWRPERWLEADTQFLKSIFNAFSAGLTACVGQGLARAELSLTTAYVLTCFDFRVAEEGCPERDLGAGGWSGAEYGRHRSGEFQLYDHITSAKKGPMVQFRRRD